VDDTFPALILPEQLLKSIIISANKSGEPSTQPRPGSFIIEHLIDIVPVGVFVSENWDRISTLLSVLKDFIEIWKLLKGDKAEKVTYNNDNSITIVVNGNGNTFHVECLQNLSV
jgi:hypothetical protein